MSALFGKRYARAIFEIASSKGLIHQYEQELQLIIDSLDQNPGLVGLLDHPKVTLGEKKEILKNIFGAAVSADILEFINVVLEKGRQRYLWVILKEYIHFSDEEYNVLRADVYSVVPLEEAEMDKIKVKLSQKFNKNVILDNKIDQELLGGIFIKAEDIVIDGSVKGKLAELKKTMLA